MPVNITTFLEDFNAYVRAKQVYKNFHLYELSEEIILANLQKRTNKLTSYFPRIIAATVLKSIDRWFEKYKFSVMTETFNNYYESLDTTNITFINVMSGIAVGLGMAAFLAGFILVFLNVGLAFGFLMVVGSALLSAGLLSTISAYEQAEENKFVIQIFKSMLEEETGEPASMPPPPSQPYSSTNSLFATPSRVREAKKDLTYGQT